VSKLFKAAMIVTIFSVITRAMGFIMKIILSRNLQASVLGEYQIAISIFSVLLTLIASGIPLIVSRKVSYFSGENKIQANKTTSAGLFLSLFLSIGFSVLLFLFRGSLSILFGSDNITQMVLSLTPALVFSSIYSILRGSLWGQKRFFAISFSEFFEQLVRIICLIVLFMIPTINISGGVIATLSLSVACIFSGLLVTIMYFKLGNKLTSPRGQLKDVAKRSSSITMARTASSAVQMLIAFIIPMRLQTFGFSETQAMAEFGIITGMALPLLTIPGTFISSIAVALVPEISSQTTDIDKGDVKDKNILKGQIAVAISTALVISFLFVPAFLSLGNPIGNIIFKNARAGTYITAGSFLMITMGVMQITSSILNAIGLEIKALKNYCLGAVVLLFCIWFLPKYLGAMSLVVAMLAMNLISSLLGLLMLRKRSLLNSNLSITTLKLVFITLMSSGITYFTNSLFTRFMTVFVSTFISGIISIASFILLCYAFNIVTVKSFITRKIFKKKYPR